MLNASADILGRYITAPIQRVRRGLRRYGFAGSIRTLMRSFATRQIHRRIDQLERSFDEEYGVDTSGIVRLEGLRFDSQNKEYGNKYQAIHPDVFRELITAVPVRHEDFVFIDYGSGKGRALLLASVFPFKSIIGVEFAPELDAVAKKNIVSFQANWMRCRRLEAVCMDAALYELPADPLVLYFYNPFERVVWERVLTRIQQSLRQSPRPAYLVFTGDPTIEQLIQDFGFAPVVSAGEAYDNSDAKSVGLKRLFVWNGQHK